MWLVIYFHVWMSARGKMKYKHIHFVEIENEGKKTKRWECKSNLYDEMLGEVAWYSQWRQYCYYTLSDIEYSASCLSDIANFLIGIKDERQATNEQRTHT